MKKFKLVAYLLVVVMLFAACTPAAQTPSDSPPAATPDAPPAAPGTPPGDEPGTAAAENPNIPDYNYVFPHGTVFDINTYYNSIDPLLDCDVTIRQTGGTVEVPDNMTTPMPQANERFTVGFSVYYTVDEVGAMILDTMVDAAAEAGINLLTHDANYDQNAQNVAIEQWILQGVDGVILAPCDFYGVRDALERLEAAGIPAITLNAPLAGSADSIVFAECSDQGRLAAEMLINHLNAQGTPISGKIIINNISFLHPNAVLREKGFMDAFAGYPDVEFIVLSALSPEEHYIAFEGALLAHPDMIGAYGIYSSATIGMMNAKLANNSTVPITSIDNDKIILAGIYDGNLVGSACYSSIAPSWWAMTLMVNQLNGVTIPGMIWYENRAVTRDNVEAMFEHYYPGQTLAGFMAGQ